MKRIFSFTLACLLAATSSAIAIQAAAPAQDAPTSAWVSWFKSLRRPNREDARRAQAYVNSKWRCLRRGKNCSKKERVALVLLATATAALIGKGIHSFAMQTPQTESITESIREVISVERIRDIARKNLSEEDNYRGELITFNDWEYSDPSISPRIRYPYHGIDLESLSFSTLKQDPKFADLDKYDQAYDFFLKAYAFVATYMIKNKRSKVYIKAQAGYPTKAQAEKFIKNMDAEVNTLGLRDQYKISTSVDSRLFF